MARTLRAFAMASALAISPIALGEIVAQEFSYSGSAGKGIKVKTNASPTRNEGSIGGGSGPFRLLGSSELTVHVNAGDSDLFVYEIQAQCEMHGGDEDHLLFQARVNGAVRGVLGGPAILQPQTTPGAFVCGGPRPPLSSVASSWVARLTGGSEGFDYTFTIWWRMIDEYPHTDILGYGHLAKRIVKLTRYD